MKFFPCLNHKILVAITAFVLCGSPVNAQMSSLLSDTISAKDAGLRRTQSTAVNFSVAKLNNLLTTCLNEGINEVQFIFVKIREQDTERYLSRHSDRAPADRRSLVGKPTLLIKVPRSAFHLALNEDPEKNDKVKSMMAGGFFPLSNSHVRSLFSNESYLYFDSGVICPPPSDCQ